MEQHIRCAIDSPLLQRVSKVREHMGLEVLPTEIPVSALNPFLSYLVRKEDDDNTVQDLTVVLQEQLQYHLRCDEKWEQWDDWSKWAKNGH